MLLELARQTTKRSRPAVPDGKRIYAIGDVHGRLDLFEQLLELIGEDQRANPADDPEIVLLGDYVDRGPRSAQLLDRIYVGPPDWCEWVVLRGNHEQVMLDILEQRDELRDRFAAWLQFGGRETLRSYGMPFARAYADDLDAILAEMPSLIPPAHEEFLRSMPLTYRSGDYFFVHAGIRPGVPLEAQQERDLLWIRNEFLDSALDHGVVVVHGHSISPEAEERPNRIGIDTGAYASGRLTALVLEGDSRRFLATAAPEEGPASAGRPPA